MQQLGGQSFTGSPAAQRGRPSIADTSDADASFSPPAEQVEGEGPQLSSGGERLIPRGTQLSSSASAIMISPSVPEEGQPVAASTSRIAQSNGIAVRAPIKRNAPLAQSVPGSRTFNELIGMGGGANNVLVNLERADYNTSEWVFRNTVSFWVGVFFVEGSILFIVGSAAAAFHPHAEWRQAALIGYPYFAGSITYTAGTYLGYYEVINVGRVKRRFFGCSGATRAGFWGTTLYLIGALLFNVNCSATFVSPTTPEGEHAVAVYMEGLTGTVGSLFFLAAAIIEWAHNWHANSKQKVFWLCLSYFWGSALFLVGSLGTLVVALMGGASTTLTVWTVDIPFTAGAVFFLFGAWVTTRMWKAEQFGLAFMNEINDFAPAAPNSTMPEDKLQKFSSAVYMMFAAVSILDFCSLSAWHVHSVGGIHHPVIFAEETLITFANLVAAHTLLLLVTVVHRTPAVSPYKYLVWLMQIVAVLYCGAITLRWLKYFVDDAYMTNVPVEPKNDPLADFGSGKPWE